jgi:uncharacterized protein involved in type VI secretion and phage assembly
MEDLLTTAIEHVRDRYYGKYRGAVVDNEDPQRRGRLRVRIPSVLGETETTWALPCLPYGGTPDVGLYLVPDVDARVWVEFEEGDIGHPLWVGTFWPSGAGGEATGDPQVRGLRTASGHELSFEDHAGAERTRLAHPAGALVTIDEQGTVTVADAAGATVTLDAAAGRVLIEDANGNAVELSSQAIVARHSGGGEVRLATDGVTVTGNRLVLDAPLVQLGGTGGEPVLKGQSFLTAYLAHTHPTAWGPSGPPIPTGEPTSLSTSVLTT